MASVTSTTTAPVVAAKLEDAAMRMVRVRALLHVIGVETPNLARMGLFVVVWSASQNVNAPLDALTVRVVHATVARQRTLSSMVCVTLRSLLVKNALPMNSA